MVPADDIREDDGLNDNFVEFAVSETYVYYYFWRLSIERFRVNADIFYIFFLNFLKSKFKYY